MWGPIVKRVSSRRNDELTGRTWWHALLTSIAFAHVSLPLVSVGPALAFAQTVVFEEGTDGYASYRVPATVASPNGDILAFAEGRTSGRKDHGNIDIVMRRSSDGGRSWGPLRTVFDFGPNTAGNPVPILDRERGTVLLLVTVNGAHVDQEAITNGSGSRDLLVFRSRDNGETWTFVTSPNGQIKSRRTRWLATGPGHGVQLQKGPHRGRLVAPVVYNSGPAGAARPAGVRILLSDDGGSTWRSGATLRDRRADHYLPSESQLAEVGSGTLYVNSRNRGADRAVSYLRNGGTAIAREGRRDRTLPCPAVQGSVLAVERGVPGRVLLFANPADDRHRRRMTVRASLDGGRSWPAAREVHHGPSGYSDLVEIPGLPGTPPTVGLLYESGEEGGRSDARIVFVRLELAWLLAGAHITTGAVNLPRFR